MAQQKVALITGITGQDGSYLAEFLLEKGIIVYGIKRRGPDSVGVAKMYAGSCHCRPRPAIHRGRLHGCRIKSGMTANRCIESPRRGETFVTRKITRGLANISQGLESCLYMGNIDALRDWGHAKDYVSMQWLMLQQDHADDFVIATGVQYTVRQYIEKTATALGMQMRWDGAGINEVGYWSPSQHSALEPQPSSEPVVRIDPRYFRPTEVETLLGDPSKAKQKLGWMPEITLNQMIEEMAFTDLAEAKKIDFLKKHGYNVNVSVE
jgi:GDP-D-mannose dehydratase